MSAGLPIATPRLLLRRFEPDDLPTLLAYRSDPTAGRWQSWGATDEAGLREFIAEYANRALDDPRGLQIAVARRDSGAHIGDVFFRPVEFDERQAEIGYTITPAQQGQGFGVEAVRALLGYLFEQRGLHRVLAYVAAPNAASVALLARAGLRREGHTRQSYEYRSGWADEYLYAVLASEWRAGRAG